MWCDVFILQEALKKFSQLVGSPLSIAKNDWVKVIVKLFSGKHVFAVLPGFGKSLPYPVLPFASDIHESNDSVIK